MPYSCIASAQTSQATPAFTWQTGHIQSLSGKLDMGKTVEELGLKDNSFRSPRYAANRFYYSAFSTEFDAAGVAFEKVTGQNIYDALEHDLAQPPSRPQWQMPGR